MPTYLPSSSLKDLSIFTVGVTAKNPHGTAYIHYRDQRDIEQNRPLETITVVDEKDVEMTYMVMNGHDLTATALLPHPSVILQHTTKFNAGLFGNKSVVAGPIVYDNERKILGILLGWTEITEPSRSIRDALKMSRAA